MASASANCGGGGQGNWHRLLPVCVVAAAVVAFIIFTILLTSAAVSGSQSKVTSQPRVAGSTSSMTRDGRTQEQNATIMLLRTAIAADPDDVAVYMELADFYMNPDVDDLEVAIQILKECISANPRDPAAYLRLGTAELALGHSAAASRALAEHRRLTTGS